MKRNNHLFVLVIILITISHTACAPAVIQPTSTPIPASTPTSSPTSRPTATPQPTPTPLPGLNTPVEGTKWNITLKQVRLIQKFQTVSMTDISNTIDNLLVDPIRGKPVIQRTDTFLTKNIYEAASGFYLIAVSIVIELNDPEAENTFLPFGYLKSVEADEPFRLVAVSVENELDVFDIVYWMQKELSGGLYSYVSADGPQNAILVFGVTSTSWAERGDYKLEFPDYPELTFFIPRDDIQVK